MNKELILVIGGVLTFICLIAGIEQLALPVDLHTYKLALTSEGCNYAESIKLPTKRNGSQCEVQVRFQPYKISSGGVIHTDDDQTIAVTDAMILSTIRSTQDLPMTRAQQDALKWLWIWLATAIVIGGATFIYFKRK